MRVRFKTPSICIYPTEVCNNGATDPHLFDGLFFLAMPKHDPLFSVERCSLGVWFRLLRPAVPAACDKFVMYLLMFWPHPPHTMSLLTRFLSPHLPRLHSERSESGVTHQLHAHSEKTRSDIILEQSANQIRWSYFGPLVRAVLNDTVCPPVVTLSLS